MPTIFPHPIKAVLFDLDGTLADTAQDLAAALNATLTHFGQTELPFEQIRPMVSHGGIALIYLGFGLTPNDDGYTERRTFLLDYYQQNICSKTVLFDGMATLLDKLEDNNMPWGIVTNKPSWLTNPLLEALDLRHRADVVISGDTLAKNKPDPLPMTTACDIINTAPCNTLYIGDAARDIEAANNAGMPSIVALFGYIDDDPSQWGTPHMIQHASEIADYLT